MQTRENIRKEILSKLKNQKPLARSQKSQLIRKKLVSGEEFKKAKKIFCYISLNTEVDTKGLIREIQKLEKRLFVPVIEGDRLRISELKDLDKDLERSTLGVLQPKKNSFVPFPPAELDLAIIPGLAFDRKGKRLGRGRGYFDRFLKDLPKKVKTIGLAFDFQILKTIPIDSHDIPVDLVISN